MKIIDCLQGSDEWVEARLGFVTASNFDKVLNKGTGRGLYMRKLAAERLTGLRENGYYDKNMEAGNETENEARNYYQTANDCNVEPIGFVVRDDDIGGSPDGFVGENGLIEIKCPLSSTHISYFLSGKMPSIYVPQVQGLLWVTGKEWCDFVSYDPRVIAKPMFCIKIKRDKDYIVNLSARVSIFVKELQEIIQKISGDF